MHAEESKQTAVCDPTVASAVCRLRATQLLRRRKMFYAIVILYLPLMWLAHRISPAMNSMVIMFIVWMALLFLITLYAALARCPRCGHYFHMHGMTLLFLRRCLHCHLHVNQLYTVEKELVCSDSDYQNL